MNKISRILEFGLTDRTMSPELSSERVLPKTFDPYKLEDIAPLEFWNKTDYHRWFAHLCSKGNNVSINLINHRFEDVAEILNKQEPWENDCDGCQALKNKDMKKIKACSTARQPKVLLTHEDGNFNGICYGCMKVLDDWNQRDLAGHSADNVDGFISSLCGARYSRCSFSNFKLFDGNSAAASASKSFSEEFSKNRNCESLIISGESMSGKSHLAAAISRYVFLSIGVKASLIFIDDVINKKESWTIPVTYRETVMASPLLIIDDLGAEAGGKFSEANPYISRLLEHRRNNMLPTVFLTSLDSLSLSAKIGQKSFNRIRHMCSYKIFEIRTNPNGRIEK